MANLKNCPSCEADYDDMLPKCPYCGSMNYKGAEAEYLDKLEDVRSDMEELGSVPEEETRREFRRQGRFFKIVLVIVAVLALLFGAWYWWVNWEPERDPKADYLWKQTNYPIFDELYEQGKYEELVELYIKAIEEEQPIFQWEHNEFCNVMENCFFAMDLLERLETEGELPDYRYEDLVYFGWKMDGPYLKEHLTEDELERVMPYVEPLLDDFYTRWEFTEEERQEFIEDRDADGGYPSYDLCEDYIKRWMKENK